MAQIKISELTALAEIEDTDVLAGVDTSNASTVKIPAIYLKQYVNKEQDKTLTELATNIETNAENIKTNAENIKTNTDNISENNESIKSNASRIKRMESNLYDSGVENGSSINIKDSTLAEFQEIIIDGISKQTITNGNQLIDFTNPNSVSSNITYNFKNDTILASLSEATSGYKAIAFEVTELFKNNPGKTLSFKDDGYKVDVITADDKLLNPGVQLNIDYSDGTDNLYAYLKHFSNGKSTAYTIPSDTSNIKRVRVQIYLNNNNVIADNNLTITKPLLYFDDNDTYEPYTGGEASPRPDWQQPISVIDKAFNVKSVGKNRFNEAEVTEKTFILEDGTTNKNNNWISYLKPIKVIPNEKYTFSRDENEVDVFQCIIAEYNKNGQIIKYNNYYVSGGVYKYTMTTQANTDYVYLAYRSDFLHTDLQFEIGDKRTNFESYQETSSTIILPDGEFAGKIDDTSKDQFKIKWNDEDKNYHVYLEKNLHKETFNGTEAWSTLSISGNYKRTSIKLSKKAKIVFESDKRSTGISDYFIVSSHYPNDKPGFFAISTNANGAYFYPLQDSLDEFKAWLSEHNTTIIYPIAEAYELDLGSVDMLLTYLGQTNVFTDSTLNPNMLVKYYREFVATIRNLQVNNDTLQGELADVQTRLSALETSLNNLLVSQVSGQVESEVVE